MARLAMLLPAVLLAGAALAPAADAQTPGRRTVTGQVLDESTRQPLMGAVVSIEAMERRAVTDAAGRFAFRTVSDGINVFVVDYLGYAKRIVTSDIGPGRTELSITLRPDPVRIEGITVAVRGIEQRRKAVGMSVRVFDRAALLTGASSDATQFILSRLGVSPAPCLWPQDARPGVFFPATIGVMECVRLRGAAVHPEVMIDERPAFGLSELAMYRPDELYMIEVFGRGRHIRAYTNWFIERSAGRSFMPIVTW